MALPYWVLLAKSKVTGICSSAPVDGTTGSEAENLPLKPGPVPLVAMFSAPLVSKFRVPSFALGTFSAFRMAASTCSGVEPGTAAAVLAAAAMASRSSWLISRPAAW